MLSFPVERLLWEQDADGGGNGGGEGEGGGGFWEFRHGHHHRLRLWQLQQQLEEKQRRAREAERSRSYSPGGNSEAAVTRTKRTRPPATRPLPGEATAATEEGARRLAAAGDTAAASNGAGAGADITPRLPLRSSMGTHFVHAHVGTPPQSVRLIVDTGSYTTAFPCVGCSKCRPESTAPFWDPALSSTALALDCQGCSGGYK